MTAPTPQDFFAFAQANPEAARQLAARYSFSAFIRLMFGDGYEYTQARFQEHLVRTLEAVERGEKRRVIIVMPPGHTKSTHASVHFPAWYLGRNPNREIIAASYGAALVENFSRQARGLFESPRWPFPNVHLDPKRAAIDDWRVAPPYRGGYRASGVGGPVTGRRANVLLIDDPVKGWAEAQSETDRNKNWNWFIGDAITRLQPTGAIVVIGTRWHEDDLIGRCLSKEYMPDTEWEVIHYPAEAEDGDILGRAPGEYLWPEYFPEWRYDEIKKEVGATVWTTLYQGMPFPAEGNTFRRENWQSYTMLPACKRFVVFVDSAFKDGIANDYSVFALWGDTGLGDYYVIDVWRERVQFPELIRAGFDLHTQWLTMLLKAGRGVSVLPFVVEDKASGQSAIQVWSRPFLLEDGTKIPSLKIIPYPIPSGQSKVARNEGVSPYQQSHHVFLPAQAPWREAFIAEHAAFPAGVHDDMVDTTGMALSSFAQQPSKGARSY